MAFKDFQSSALPTELSCQNHLAQHVVAGAHYARRKANGKPVRAGLETTIP